MSKKALLDFIPDARKQIIYHEESGKTYCETRQDVAHIVRAAEIMSDQPPGKDFRHAAFIPEAVLDQSFLEGWFHDKLAWKKWANDPENAKYRTWKGRL